MRSSYKYHSDLCGKFENQGYGVPVVLDINIFGIGKLVQWT